MELFNKKYLHCIWSEEIEGKECLLCGDLINLIRGINSGKVYDPRAIVACGHVKRSDGVQITAADGTTWVYAYYDPNYECKVAYNEGKQIEYRETTIWRDTTRPRWRDGVEYRVKLADVYRPFKDCNELINTIGTKRIWVTKKEDGTEFLILGYSNNNKTFNAPCVSLSGVWFTMEELFERFTFGDGSPCGIKEQTQ